MLLAIIKKCIKELKVLMSDKVPVNCFTLTEQSLIFYSLYVFSLCVYWWKAQMPHAGKKTISTGCKNSMNELCMKHMVAQIIQTTKTLKACWIMTLQKKNLGI